MRYLYWLLLVPLWGCASREVASPDAAAVAAADRDRLLGLSSIQIDYVRGSNHHRFIATAKPDSALVELFSETKLLRQGKIGREKFDELAKEAQTLASAQVAQQSLARCRTPFVLKLTNDDSTRKVEGCRSDDEGAAVGKLIRQAEFLVHSQD